jgi:hypothetical protein
LRTGAKALLRASRRRWSIENSWHWVRYVPLGEDAHRYRENNGVQILATLRSLAINALLLDGIWSITEGMVALGYDIKGLLRLLGCRELATTASSQGPHLMSLKPFLGQLDFYWPSYVTSEQTFAPWSIPHGNLISLWA